MKNTSSVAQSVILREIYNLKDQQPTGTQQFVIDRDLETVQMSLAGACVNVMASLQRDAFVNSPNEH